MKGTATPDHSTGIILLRRLLNSRVLRIMTTFNNITCLFNSPYLKMTEVSTGLKWSNLSNTWLVYLLKSQQLRTPNRMSRQHLILVTMW